MKSLDIIESALRTKYNLEVQKDPDRILEFRDRNSAVIQMYESTHLEKAVRYCEVLFCDQEIIQKIAADSTYFGTIGRNMLILEDWIEFEDEKSIEVPRAANRRWQESWYERYGIE